MKIKHRIKKVLKWIVIVFTPLFILMTWGPTDATIENTGQKLFSWNGWSALFNDRDFELKINYYPKVNFDGIDGPYIAGGNVYYVNSQNKLTSSVLTEYDSLRVKVNNKYHDIFHFSMKGRHNHEIPAFAGNFNTQP